ncbi:hypothetical protein BDZ91DRAFT_709921 [Kalaharituber pfeilii]|nr:hypothetical protein BDZ91DRAFT_709921 [Kalaharituber pfeilii]
MADELVKQLLSQLPPPLNLVSAQLAAVAKCAFSIATPVLSLISGPATTVDTNGVSPMLINTLLLILIVTFLLKLVSAVSRWMYNMVLTVIRIALYFGLFAVAWSIYNRGFSSTKEDVLEFLETVGANEHLEKLAQQAAGATYSSGRSTKRG